MSALRRVAVAAAVLFLGMPGRLAAGPVTCDSDALTQAIAACGMDIACMNQATADYNAQCSGQTPPNPSPSPTPSPGGGSLGDIEQRLAECGMDIACMNRLMQEAQGGLAPQPAPSPSPSPPPPSPTPPPPTPPTPSPTPGQQPGGGMGGGGMGGDMMQQLQACGNDPACLQRVTDDMRNGGGDDFDTTKRLGERTVLSPSWLQTYQEALVACGNDAGCWQGHMAASNGKVTGTCGSNLMSEATMICQISARYEIHIEQAIAQQRLWRQGVRFDGGAPGATQGTQAPNPAPAVTPSPSPSPAPEAEPTPTAFTFLQTVSEAKVRHILDRWEGELAGRIPREGRDRIAAAAEAFPPTADEALPPLVYEEKDTPEGLAIDAKPTRRDWAFALTGLLLTDAGFAEGGSRGRVLLDTALWSLIQAAKLKLEAAHLANIGFHLNLRGKTADARDVLTYAHSLEPERADTENNLAFSYAAMGKTEEAKALQQDAARLAPDDTHIRSRLDALLGGEGRAQGSAAMPYGGDFGEAYFRLGKRHTLREYWAGKAWHKARELAKGQAFGGTPTVAGPHEWYTKQLKDIEDSHSTCTARAPKEARGCPFGAYVYHPSCKNAASPEEVARSIHNRKVALCQCDANALMAKADALSAYLDRAIAVWTAYEKAWRPRLARYVPAWSADIKAVNARYTDGSFEFPVDTGYSQWPAEFREDSEDAWTSELPDIAARWHDLKSQAQSLKSCGTRLPPSPEKPKKPKAEPEKKVKKYGINLFVVSFELRMDGNFKFNFDLGFIKGGYERVVGKDGHKFEIGSGPIEFSYQTNAAPGPGGNSSRFTMTASANFFEFVPGAGGTAAKIMDQFVSFGGKYEVGWGDRSGFTGNATVENKTKFGFTSTEVSVPRGTRMLN